MSSRRIAALTLSFAVAAFAATSLLGCANIEDDTDLQQGEQELSPAASNLVGVWIPAVTTLEVGDVEAGSFHDLTLRDDESFVAHLVVSSSGMPVSGTWKSRRYQGGVRLYLTVDGTTTRYEVERNDDLLTLRDASGITSTLQPDACADVVCAATLTCVDGACVPFADDADACADVVCAATLTCIDGACVPFVDDADACGDVVCAAGTVCCNPLASLCVAPGEACAL